MLTSPSQRYLIVVISFVLLFNPRYCCGLGNWNLWRQFGNYGKRMPSIWALWSRVTSECFYASWKFGKRSRILVLKVSDNAIIWQK